MAVHNDLDQKIKKFQFKKQISKWTSILVPILLGFVLIIYAYKQFTPAQLLEIKTYFSKANYFYIFISLMISTLGGASRAYRWKYSLEHLGYKTTFANNFMAVSIGYFMNMTIPRSGEFSRALILKKYNNIPFDKGFGTIVAERIVDTIILLLLVIITFFLQFNVVKAFVLDKIPLEKTLWIVFIGVVLMTSVVLIYFYSKIGIVLSIKEKISGLKEGILSIVKMKNKGWFIFHTLFIWVSYVLMFYITIFTLNETQDLSMGAVLSSFIVGSIAIAVTSSGFGAYPVLMAKILLFYGVAATAGTAFGWIVWTSQILLVTITGLISFLLLPLLNKNK